MIYLDNPVILLEWSAKEKWLRIELRGFIDGDDYRSALDKALDVLIAKGAAKVLWDLRKMKALTPDDQAWAEGDWTPRLMKLSKVRYSALVVPQSTVAQMTIKRVNDRTTPLLEKDLVRSYFGSPEEAVKWLRAVDS